MTEEQIKKVHMTQDKLGTKEIARITHIVALSKRFLELMSLLPEAEEEFLKDEKAFLDKYGLDELDPKDLDPYFIPGKQKEFEASLKNNPDKVLEIISENYFRYKQFVSNKVKIREALTDKILVPKNDKMRVWRERQINRCNGNLGGVNRSFVHAPICYEMADGCSMGCEFCGLAAGKLTKVFRYTEENAKLFREVLAVCNEVIGYPAGHGMLYFATEPMDNPDYEKFEDVFFKEFNTVPQITTAAPLRNIEKLKMLIERLPKRHGLVHRFTVLSLDIARKIFEEYTPDELLLVELIAQYKEAPSFVEYVSSGKNHTHSDEYYDPGTIVCIDGFCVNFVTKKITLFTPCKSTNKHPRGISEMPPVYFEDATDFKNKLLELIDKYMVNDLSSEEVLKLYSYFELRNDDKHGEVLYSHNGGEMLLLSKLPKDISIPTIKLLNEGKWTKREIVKKVCQETGEKPEKIFWLINQFWKQGFIVDKMFFEE